MTIKIKDLSTLKKWIENPTEEKPIVLEWFMDWFFEELIDRDRIVKAIEARKILIQFAIICENLTEEQAIKRVDTNFDYYSGHAITRWRPKWLKLKEYLRDKNEKVFQSKWVLN